MNQDVTKLSLQFSKILNEWLTPEEIEEINIRNSGEYSKNGCCGTHDFCDPNQAMIDAFLIIEGRDLDFNSDEDEDLINRAWQLSITNKFKI